MLFRSNEGKTFLHYAAEEDFSDVLIKALEVDSNLAKLQNIYGETFLYVATKKGRSDVLIKALEVDPSFAKVQDEKGKTFLHDAADRGFIGVLSIALKINPELLTIKTKKGQSVLDLARETSSKRGREAAFSEFFKLADPMYQKEVQEKFQNARDLLNERKNLMLGEDRR